MQLPDWERFLETIAQDILVEQSPKALLGVRAKVYQLLINCVPATVLLRTLTLMLIDKVPEPLKPDIAVQAAFYEHRMLMGQKDIFHIEAFVAKIMHLLKTFLVTKMGGSPAAAASGASSASPKT